MGSMLSPSVGLSINHISWYLLPPPPKVARISRFHFRVVCLLLARQSVAIGCDSHTTILSISSFRTMKNLRINRTWVCQCAEVIFFSDSDQFGLTWYLTLCNVEVRPRKTKFKKKISRSNYQNPYLLPSDRKLTDSMLSPFNDAKSL